MSNEAYKAENSIRVQLRFFKGTGVPDALEEVTAKTGETMKEYCRRVIVDALIRDGYLSKPKENE